MRKGKKFMSVVAAACMIAGIMSYGVTAGVSAADSDETKIVFSSGDIFVNDSTISEDQSAAVYVSEKTETHEDVAEDLKNVVNTVVTITDAGTYRFSGTAEDTQIAVSAGEDDQVTLILDNLDITCRTAAAIQIYSAYEPATQGEAGVTLYLEDGSVSRVNGSHTLATEEDPVKHDAAVSSNVSLLIDGTGSLEVTGDNEGIEVKYKHLTFQNGTVRISSQDDPVNGSEDGVAVVTVNGGYLYCKATGAEGDGMDSNGYITINGGTVIALASPNSMDSGLDSDMGTTINGGTVVGAGNMFDALETDSQQLYMFLQFTETTDDLICVTDSEEKPVFAYDFPSNYSYISFSTPELTEGTYHVFIGGTAEGTQTDGLYTDITSYAGGTQLHHGGMSSGGMGRPDGMTPPEGMEFPEGAQPPNGMTPPEGMELPEGAQPPDGMTPPEGMEFPEGEQPAEGTAPPDRPARPEGMNPGGMGRPGGMESSSDTQTYEFVLAADSRSFTNVSAGEIEVFSFADVSESAWYYDAVMNAYEAGIVYGKSKTEFGPEDAVTGAEYIAMLCRVSGNDTDEQDNSGLWYDSAVAWAEQRGVLTEENGWTFVPENPLSREQMMVLSYRFLEAEGLNVSDESGDLSGYSDGETVSDYAKDAAAWLTAQGLIVGDGDALHPQDTLTRGEAVTILMGMLEVVPDSASAVQIYNVSVPEEFYTAFSGSTETYFPDGFKTGFGSGLTFKGYDEEGNPQFYGVTDRGPSLDMPEDAALSETYAAAKIFPAPDFSPSIGVITLKDGQAVVEETIQLKDEDGTPLTGLPLPEGETGATGETALDIDLEVLDSDPDGLDPEGIAVDAEGNFWIADEYGPFIVKFRSDGTLLEKYAPGDGLPEILKYRIANRGFEGLTISPSGKIYASVQSVLDIEGETSTSATFIRIIELDPSTGQTRQFAYPVDVSAYQSPKSCKIGDIYAVDDTTLLVMEQGELADGTLSNVVYKVDLTNASDISGILYDGQELEYTADAAALSEVITYGEKEALVDLREMGWTAEKAEGMCLMDDGTTLALIIEDDFGLAGASVSFQGEQESIVLNEIDAGNASKLWLIDLKENI